MIELVKTAVEELERATENLRRVLDQGETKKESGFVTIQQAAQMLGISVNGVYRLTHLKKIPYYRPTGKRLYFKPEDMRAFMAQNRVKTDREEESEVLKKAFV